jgi:hypothetical protein
MQIRSWPLISEDGVANVNWCSIMRWSVGLDMMYQASIVKTIEADMLRFYSIWADAATGSLLFCDSSGSDCEEMLS